MSIPICQIIQLGHMDCIIQHWSIKDIRKLYHPFPRHCSPLFPRMITIRSQETNFQNLPCPRLGRGGEIGD